MKNLNFTSISFVSLVFVLLSLSSIAQTTVFNENFEGTLQVTPTGTPAWSVNTTLQVSGTNSYHAVVGLNSVSYFETNTINLAGYTNVLLDFQHICKVQLGDSARIFVSVNNGLSWQVIPNSTYLGSGIYFLNNMEGFTAASYATTWLPGNPSAVPNNTWWKNEQFDISSLVANQSQVKFRFYLKDGNSDGSMLNAGWFIDDIKIIAAFSELIPPVVTLVSPIFQGTVFGAGPFAVNATITDASGISSAKLFYKINTLSWDSVVMANTTGNNYMGEIPGQPYNTNFQYYVLGRDASPAQNAAQSATLSFVTQKPSPVHTLGTGTVSTSLSGVTPYTSNVEGARIQYVIRASELTALGVGPGPIFSLAFDVSTSGAGTFPQLNYTIKMGHTQSTELNGSYGTLMGNWTTVYFNNSEPAPPVGWKTHAFTTPFFWNGTSNILIDICHENDPTGTCASCISSNSSVNFTATSFPSVFGRHNNNAAACNVNPTTAITSGDYNKRPNMRITVSSNTNNNDAGVVLISEPTGVILTTNPLPLKVRFKNYGLQTLTSVNIGWSLNGTLQNPFAWTGTLFEDVTSGITQIGSANFAQGINVIRAWTYLPNGQTDQNVLNDTITSFVYGCSNILSGTYTIDSTIAASATNFRSFDDAIAALTNCGVNGPVIFNVAPGTYNTRLVFDRVFPGTSSINTVTFRGTTGSIIRHSTNVSEHRAAILLSGAKFLRFDNLTITIPESSTFGQGFQLIDNSENIHITNCTINTDLIGTSSNYAGIVASGLLTSAITTGNSANDILVENNTINGGHYGIIFYGSTSTPLNNIVIRNNKVNNSYNTGIRTTYTNSVIIERNNIALRVSGGTTTSTAIFVSYEYQSFQIRRNNMVNSGQYGIYITNASAPPGLRSQISNNSIGGFINTGLSYGIYLTTCSAIDIYYNSVNLNLGTGSGIHSLATATGLVVQNNSFVYSGTGAGYAAYHAATASITAHNFNNYFSTGTNFVFYGAARANLTALRAVNQPAGNDLSSVTGDPVYISLTNLKPLGSILNNAATPIANLNTDIVGNPRSLTTPDIGAYEFAPVSADLFLTNANLVAGFCLSANDSIYFTLKNIVGGAVNLSVHPVIARYVITGPVSTSGMFSINSGTINPNQSVKFGFAGINLSAPGNYTLKAFIEPNPINLATETDTLNNAFQLHVPGELFDASPNSVLITNSTTTVPLSVNSNLFPGSGFFITEICHNKAAPGVPVNGWPSYLIANNYIEITGVPGTDLAGHTLEQWSSSALLNSHTFPPGTVLGPNGTAIIAVGQPGTSVPSPSNYYYHGNVSGSFSPTTATGRILKNQYGVIVEAVGYGTYTFPAASGVTSSHWSGNTPAVAGAGNRLNGAYTKTSVNWESASITLPQDPNSYNPGLVFPLNSSIAGFNWSYGGIVTSTNKTDTIVGPWSVNGVYNYIASYTSPCGLKTDTVIVNVGIPLIDLQVIEILTPQNNICSNGTEQITARIANYGINAISGNFTASFKLNNETPVTENVNLTIPPAGSVLYTFSTPLQINQTIPTQSETTYTLKVWATYAADPYHDNDTATVNRTLGFKGQTPTVLGATINYGDQAQLTATSSSLQHYWFVDSLSASHIHVGNVFTTPPLFNDRTYWVESRNTPPQVNATIGTGTLTTSANGITPYTSFYEGARVQYLIRASEMTALGLIAGNINSMAFNVTASGVGTYPQLNYTIKIAHTNTNALSSTAYDTPSGPWNTVYVAASEPAPPVGWRTYNFSTPFSWNGTSNILIDICHENDPNNTCSLCYSSNSTVQYSTTSFNSVYGRYNDNAPACNVNPTTAITTFNNRPNIRFISESVSCPSDRVPVTANVILPAVDVFVTSILSPVNNQCSKNSDTVRVVIHNNGFSDITSGLTASYQVNQGTPVTEPVTQVLHAGDSIIYQFLTPINLNLTSGYSTITLKSWATHPLDTYNVNDTTQTQLKLFYTPPVPLASDVTIPYENSATLTAQSNGSLRWYDSPTSGTVLQTGSTYVTPILYGSTPYYVAASAVPSASEQMGILNAVSTTSSISAAAGWGLFFSNTEHILVDTVHVYPQGTGTITIQILDSLTNNVLYTGPTINLTGNGTNSPSNKVAVPVGLTIPPGSYKMGMQSTGIINLIREASGATPPYIAPSGIARITAGAVGTSVPSPAQYFWFYDWRIRNASSQCMSDRAEVWAIVNPATLPPVDAGVVSINEPVSPTDLSPQPVKVTFRNYGQNPLTSVDLMWSINGVAQPTFNWTGNLPSGAIVNNFSIGTASFFIGTNNLKVWTSLPNGFIDNYPTNDTAVAVINAFEPLCGNYTIGGPGSDFPDFATAMHALYNYGVTCPVVFDLMLPVFNLSLVFDSIPGSSAVNTVTFRPGPGVNVEITSASATATVRFNAAKHIIFDGFSTGSQTRNLTISNTSSATNTAAIWISSTGTALNQGCQNITIRNCNIEAGSNSVTSSFGIYIGGTTISTTATGANNNQITIYNNHIKKSYIAVYSRSASPNFNTGLTIEKNVIGSVDPLEYVTFRGIDLQGATNPLISGNRIFNLILSTSVNNAGIEIGQNVSGARIVKNNIHTLRSLSPSGYGAFGINIASGTGVSNILIANNFISDIMTTNYNNINTQFNPFGIRITGGSNIRVYYNSINLFGEPTIGTAASMSACLIITAAVTGLDVRNNIFANSMTGIANTKSYCVYKITAANFATSNYNDYFPSGPFGFFGYSGTADITTLAGWRTVTGQDVNSVSVNPNFFTNIDLHTVSATVNNLGTPISEIIDDIDGDLRHLTTPDIGADEFDLVAKDAAVIEGLAPLSGCGLTSSEFVIVRIKNAGLDVINSLNISYSINGGTPVVETWNGTLASNQTLDYTFNQTANLSGFGTYNIFFKVMLTGDGFALNDELNHVIITSHDFLSSNFFMGFEPTQNFSRWTVVDVNNDGKTWEPGYNSPTYAKTGLRSARFNNGNTNPGNDYLFTECFKLQAGTAYKVEFWYRAESASYPHSIKLVASSGITPSSVISTLVDLPSISNTTYQLTSGIFTAPTTGVYYFGWQAYSPASIFFAFIDDINIRIIAPLDAGAVSIQNINQMENGGSTKNIQMKFVNYGSQTLTSVPVNFSINGGTPVTEIWTGNLAPDDTANYTFNTPFIVPDGNYSICVSTSIPGDGNPGNDQFCINRFGLPVIVIPYSDDFESVNYWYTEGTVNSLTQWQLGQPTASIINNAHSPVNVWATQLSGNYANNSNYYLYTPKFNFSQTQNMVLGFWHWVLTENNVDGGKVQYTTNNGLTWNTLGVLNDPNGTNWYNSANINNAPGFSGNSGGWQYSEIKLSALDLYPVPVQFRFHFYSNATVNNNGWAIDDFTIFQPQIPNDAGVTEIVAPVGQSITGAPNQVTVRLKNFGTQTLTSIPVSYRVMGGPPPVNATWTGSLTPGSETTFTFPTPYIGVFNDYKLCSWTSLSGDLYKFNDSTCVDLIAGPANIDGSVIEILNPLVETIANSNVTVSIRVKNKGLQPLVNIPVQYFINGSPTATEVIIGTLSPGAESNYTFITTFVSPSTNYQLCAKTSVSGDAIISNDQMCSDLTTIIGIAESEVNGIRLLQNIPNPAHDETVIGFSLQTGGKLTLTITNVLGEVIYSETGEYAAGLHHVTVNTKSMAAGVYSYSITFDQQKLTRKMVVK